jgi:hypothetical protein
VAEGALAHPGALGGGVTADEEGAVLILRGRPRQRLRLGEERTPGESPCPGCGTYYFHLHVLGCEMEECPACGGTLADCACDEG